MTILLQKCQCDNVSTRHVLGGGLESIQCSDVSDATMDNMYVYLLWACYVIMDGMCDSMFIVVINNLNFVDVLIFINQ